MKEKIKDIAKIWEMPAVKPEVPARMVFSVGDFFLGKIREQKQLEARPEKSPRLINNKGGCLKVNWNPGVGGVLVGKLFVNVGESGEGYMTAVKMSMSVIKYFTKHSVNQAVERGFKTADILKIIRGADR